MKIELCVLEHSFKKGVILTKFLLICMVIACNVTSGYTDDKSNAISENISNDSDAENEKRNYRGETIVAIPSNNSSEVIMQNGEKKGSGRDRRKSAKEYYEKKFRFYERIFQEEAVDLNWSVSAANRINEKFMATGVLESLDAQCKSTICKVNVKFETNKSNSMDIVEMNLPWSGVSFAKTETREKRGTLYLSRSGYNLPDFKEDPS